MTRVFTVDSNNDLVLASTGNLSISAGLEAVLQACEQAAKAQLGEMILAVDEGMPNFDVVWNGAPNFPQFEAALILRLRSVSGVTEVANVQISASAGVLSYTATIKSIYGEGGING